MEEYYLTTNRNNTSISWLCCSSLLIVLKENFALGRGTLERALDLLRFECLSPPRLMLKFNCHRDTIRRWNFDRQLGYDGSTLKNLLMQLSCYKRLSSALLISMYFLSPSPSSLPSFLPPLLMNLSIR